MKIGIVNDMPLAIEALRRALAARPDYELLWVAQDGEQAVDFCSAQRPDVVLMDLVMPKVDGIEATRRIMARAPCAILIVTVDVGANAWRVYEAMGAGALDAVDTPSLSGPDSHKSIAVLIAKIDRIGALVRERNAPGTAAAAAGSRRRRRARRRPSACRIPPRSPRPARSCDNPWRASPSGRSRRPGPCR